MRLDAWTLAVVGVGAGEEPWAEIHATFSEALASVVKAFEHRLYDLTDVQLTDQEDVANALDDVAVFTIEPAVIDTDVLAPSE